MVEQEKLEREVSTTVITANGRAFLPDLGPMPDVEVLFGFAKALGMFVGFEINTHMKWLGLDPSPVYEPRWPSRMCIGLCAATSDVPAVAKSSFQIVNPREEMGCKP